MPAYVIAYAGDVRDAAVLQEYRRRNADAVIGHGGRFLARGGAVDVLEGPWPWERCVIMEFPDAGAARAWYGSDEYAPLKAMRQAASSTQLILVEGV
ncbi:MAG TPA: DUF1330 domain-containing protein [Solirubrobacteraceae bacterium]|jgi:uncharacterized protein (DUF1330 family)|nr:DUF1330 domain-containing protein [Solirubrobacteraceae bacterium]